MLKNKYIIATIISFLVGLIFTFFYIADLHIRSVQALRDLTLHEHRQELLVQAENICAGETSEFTVTNEGIRAICK